MAEQVISPGVFTTETDQSFLTGGPQVVGAAVIGPTTSGPAMIPTVVRSLSEYESIFGTTIVSGSQNYQYLTYFTARNYFNNGGRSLLVCRVLSGSYGSATASVATRQTGSVTSLVFESLAVGSELNTFGYVSGALVSGSKFNFHYEITGTDTTTGTFNVLIRKGDDKSSNKVILEQWSQLSMDPNSNNYVSAVIGDTSFTYDSTNNYVKSSGNYTNKSQFIRVKSVNTPTPDYFDINGVAKVAYTGSLPAVGSGSFGGGSNGVTKTLINFYEDISATNTQGFDSTTDNYSNAIDLLGNKDEYRFNLLFLPGLYDKDYGSLISKAITMAENRGDCMVVVDPVAYSKNLAEVTTQASVYDSSYAAMYWPWCQTIDPKTGKTVWIPASVAMAGVFAFNDAVAAPWYAPAGLNRGGITTVTQTERKLSQAQRDSLYVAGINPIATFPGQGIVAYGQKTLQKRSSALDRVNVRRLLIELKGYIGDIAKTLVFEQNTLATRTRFLSQVNPYLESVASRQGLYAYKVVMDDTNNTPDVIDRNQLVGKIFIQPAKAIEFVLLNFTITPTGAVFE
jgi:hypothetical protein